MSRRQRRAQRERTPVDRIPGGCMDCNAYQTIDTTHAPLFVLAVHHDNTCPTYQTTKESR